MTKEEYRKKADDGQILFIVLTLIYIAVAFVIMCLFFCVYNNTTKIREDIKKNNRYYEQTTTTNESERIPPATAEEETTIIEEEVYVSPVYKQSIELCRNSYAEEIASAVRKASDKYGIDEYIIYAIIITESEVNVGVNKNGKPIVEVNKLAMSRANCYGLMQLSKYAVADYNDRFGTKYKMEDTFDINTNIEIGTWHFARYVPYEKSIIALYSIYNVGFNEFTADNSYWFYDEQGKWKNGYKNSFFYLNGLYPPTENNSGKRGLYGKNRLDTYRPVRRFEKYLALCYDYFYA